MTNVVRKVPVAALAFLLGIVIMIVSYAVQLSTQRKERRS